jgi:hypothetical protein
MLVGKGMAGLATALVILVNPCNKKLLEQNYHTDSNVSTNSLENRARSATATVSGNVILSIKESFITP